MSGRQQGLMSGFHHPDLLVKEATEMYLPGRHDVAANSHRQKSQGGHRG